MSCTDSFLFLDLSAFRVADEMLAVKEEDLITFSPTSSNLTVSQFPVHQLVIFENPNSIINIFPVGSLSSAPTHLLYLSFLHFSMP